MTETHERRISHKELTLISFTCKHCKGELTFDITNTEQRKRVVGAEWAVECPWCGKPFHKYLSGAFVDYWAFLQKLEAAEHEVIFRTPIAS